MDKEEKRNGLRPFSASGHHCSFHGYFHKWIQLNEKDDIEQGYIESICGRNR